MQWCSGISLKGNIVTQRKGRGASLPMLSHHNMRFWPRVNSGQFLVLRDATAKTVEGSSLRGAY